MGARLTAAAKAKQANVVNAALGATRADWVHVGIFSAAVNLLMLTGSLYMLQVYDRVLTSRSTATLVGVSLIALAAFLLQGVLDAARLRLLSRIGGRVDEALAPLVARAVTVFPLRGIAPGEVMQPMRDLDSLRGFLSGLGPTALIDMPFMPLFLAGCFLLHPWLGLLALGGAVAIVGLTLATERRTKPLSLDLARSSSERNALAEAARRNAEAIAGLGMEKNFARRYGAAHGRVVADMLAIAEAGSGLGAAARTFRFILQSAVLGLGAYLAIRGEMSAGAMIAASIMTSRALAPIEVALTNWKGFVAARQAAARLSAMLPHAEQAARQLALPAPTRAVQVVDLAVGAPGARRVIIQGVGFELKAGQGVGVIGPSGSGKSTLARALVGIWPAARGEVRLDGARLEQWESASLGRHLGYLPQDVELFDGTIAENIARLDPAFTSDAVIRAAQAAGAHEMIVSFPAGYETRIGEGGAALSGGQRQRIALARALYGDPFLIVLDEPNASLDADGDTALTEAVRAARARGAVVVVVTHRPAGLAGVDLVAAMAEGKLRAFGPREEVLGRALQPMPGKPRMAEASPGRVAQGATEPHA